MATDAKATPIATHHGVEIFVNGDGLFSCKVDGETWNSQALKTLKRRIEDHARARARAKVASLELVLAQRGGRWSQDDEEAKVKWTKGTYVGLNAHTGDVKLKLANGDIRDITYGWFFRADDLAGQKAYQEAVDAELAARAALKQAEEAVEGVTEKHGHRVNMQHRYDRAKGEQAAAAEEEFVAALTGHRYPQHDEG